MTYWAYPIPDSVRTQLLENNPEFLPSYPDVIGHHITIIPPNLYGMIDKKTGKMAFDAPSPLPVNVTLYAKVDDGKGCQVILVKVNNSTVRPDNGIYHCTWSIDRAKGYKPMDSNRVILGNVSVLLENPINILTKPKLF